MAPATESMAHCQREGPKPATRLRPRRMTAANAIKPTETMQGANTGPTQTVGSRKSTSHVSRLDGHPNKNLRKA